MSTNTEQKARSHVGDTRTFEEAAKAAERAIYTHRLLSPEEEKQLARANERGDFAAKQKLIEHNLRLVRQIAINYSRSCRFLSVEDIFAAGVEGLTRAAEKFDYRKGFRFTTYAHAWIEQAIGREIANKEQTIRAPVHIRTVHNKLARAHSQFENENSRPPTDEELAELTDVRKRDIADWHVARQVVSLNKPLANDDDTGEFGDFLADPDADTARSATSNTEQERAARAIAKLAPREREIVELRYLEELSLKAVALRTGLPLNEIRQIERSAIKNLESELTGAEAA